MTAARLTAFLIAALALTGVGWQFHLNGYKPDLEPWLARGWGMLRYFTIISNLLVAGFMLQVALGRPSRANVAMTLTLSIIMVGIIYRLLLAPEVPLQSPDWYPDFLMHVVVPVAVPLWWLAFADKRLELRALPLWLSLPAVYCVYALIRGVIGGKYPYFFLDVGRFGLPTVLLFCVGLVAVFAVCGVVLWAVARLMTRRSA